MVVKGDVALKVEEEIEEEAVGIKAVGVEEAKKDEEEEAGTGTEGDTTTTTTLTAGVILTDIDVSLVEELLLLL